MLLVLWRRAAVMLEANDSGDGMYMLSTKALPTAQGQTARIHFHRLDATVTLPGHPDVNPCGK